MSYDIDPRVASILEQMAPCPKPSALAVDREAALTIAAGYPPRPGRRAMRIALVTAALLVVGVLAVGSALGLGLGDLYVFKSEDAPIRSTQDANTFFGSRDDGFRQSSGLSADDPANTREIYRFDDQLANFAAGLSAYKTDVAKGGFCITFANATSCSPEAPTAEEPLKGIGFDPDAEDGGQPFVLISIKASEVTGVTYTCAGTTYSATISGKVVVFISPSSSLAAGDCVANSTFSSGEVLSRGV